MTTVGDAQAEGFDHVVVGGGKFGLGFASELADRAGWRTAVLFRNDCSTKSQKYFDALSSDGSYEIRFFGGEARSISVTPIRTSYTNISEDARRLFSSERLKMISVAVPSSAMGNAACLLAHGLKARAETLSASSSVTVLACINHEKNGPTLSDTTSELCKSLFGDDDASLSLVANSSFPLCVVDRICSDLSLVDENDKKRLQVLAEQYARLIVPATSAETALAALEASYPGLIVRVPGEDATIAMRPWQSAKYWGINGLHLFLAAYLRECYGDGVDLRISEMLAKDRQLEAAARFYIREVVAALTIAEPGHASADALSTYLHETIERFSKSPDPVDRLLRDLRLQSRGDVWKEQLLETDRRLRAVYHGTEATEDDFAARENALQEAMSDFVRFSIGGFLTKVHERVLAPARIVREAGLIPVNLGHATNLILTVLARDMLREDSGDLEKSTHEEQESPTAGS